MFLVDFNAKKIMAKERERQKLSDDQKKTPVNKYKKKKSRKDKDGPSLIMFNVVMVLYGLSGKFSGGNVLMTGSLGLLVGVYVYTFASHFDDFR